MEEFYKEKKYCNTRRVEVVFLPNPYKMGWKTSLVLINYGKKILCLKWLSMHMMRSRV